MSSAMTMYEVLVLAVGRVEGKVWDPRRKTVVQDAQGIPWSLRLTGRPHP